MTSLSKFFIVPLFLCISAQTVCMDAMNSYIKKCKQVNQKNEAKLTTFLEYACNTNPTREMDKIALQLKQIQQNLDDRKQDCLIAIKRNHSIADDLWDGIIKIQQDLCKFEKKNKHIGLSDVKHDKTLPADIVLMLKKNLKNEGINPKRINLELSTADKDYSFHTAVPNIIWEIKDHIFTVKSINPGLIEINQQLIASCSHSNKEALCLMLATNMNSELSPSHIFEIIQAVTKIHIDQTDIDLFARLKTSLFILTPALKNKNNAQLLKTHYSIAYDPTFSIDDYKILSKIDRLQKALAWLKKYAAPEIGEPINFVK